MRRSRKRDQRIWSGLLLSVAVIVTGIGAVMAQSNGMWLAGTGILTEYETLTPSSLPPTLNGTGNVSCRPAEFVLQPRIPGVQSEDRQTACAVTGSQGMVVSTSFARVTGVDGAMVDYTGKSARIFAIPGTTGAVALEESAPQRFRLRYYANLSHWLRPEYNPNKQLWKYHLTGVGDWTLRDGSGNILEVNETATAFSRNGQWMVTSAIGKSVVLVNLNTAEVNAVDFPFSSDSGTLVWPQTAVSDDGRLVATAVHSGRLTITDTTTCQLTPQIINGPVSCERATLDGFLRSLGTGFQRAQHLRFEDSELLEFYGSYRRDNKNILVRSTFAPSTASPAPKRYLALGDSFSSGEGANDYFTETDTKENMCHLSRRSYPYLIGNQLSLDQFNSVACSGARMQDITSYAQRQQLPGHNTMGSLLPGYRKQLDYIPVQAPDVVTVGIGGNDVGFIGKLKACLNVGTCYTSYEDRREMVDEMYRQFDKLVSTYSQIKSTAQPNTRLYVLGYPRVADAAGSCSINVRLNQDELQLVNQLIDHLNRVIQMSAMRVGLYYINVTEAFDGHKLCETNSSNVAMNGVTAGNDIFGVIGNESFHPNARGHQLFKSTILQATNNFLQPMPTAAPTITRPEIDEAADILQAPKSKRIIRQIFNDESLATDVLIRGEPALIQIASTHALQPDATYQVELHSNVLRLGTFRATNNENVVVRVLLPSDIVPGFHTLHIMGTNTQGVAIDIYKTVYMAATSNDYDADGIVNTIDECTDLPDSNLDSDDDGVDDVCDESNAITESKADLQLKDKNREDDQTLGTSQSYKPHKVDTPQTLPIVGWLAIGASGLIAWYLLRRNRRK